MDNKFCPFFNYVHSFVIVKKNFFKWIIKEKLMKEFFKILVTEMKIMTLDFSNDFYL